MQRNIRIQLEEYVALGFGNAHQPPRMRYLTKVIAIFIDLVVTCQLCRTVTLVRFGLDSGRDRSEYGTMTGSNLNNLRVHRANLIIFIIVTVWMPNGESRKRVYMKVDIMGLILSRKYFNLKFKNLEPQNKYSNRNRKINPYQATHHHRVKSYQSKSRQISFRTDVTQSPQSLDE